MKANILFKANLTGGSHREIGKICQDAVEFYQSDCFNVLAVADGLGSESLSDIGAKVAVSTAVKHCADNILGDMETERIKTIMRDSYYAAYQAVLERARDDGNDPDEYDTTLCMAVVFPDGCVYYAQSGDSGMVVLLENGLYKRVTTQQRDDLGRVYPLCFPEKWVFGRVEEVVSAVMLMTDGLLDLVCPRLLNGREVDINVPFARRFLDKFGYAPEDIPALEEAMTRYLENVPRRLLDDDVTVIVNVATNRKPAEREAAYYEAPDWESFRVESLRSDIESPDAGPNSLIVSSDSCAENGTEPSDNKKPMEGANIRKSAKFKRLRNASKKRGVKKVIRAVFRKKTIILGVIVVVLFALIRKVIIF